MLRDLDELRTDLERQFILQDDVVVGFREGMPMPGAIDAFARNAVFNDHPAIRRRLRYALREAAAAAGIESRPLSGLLGGLRHNRNAIGTLLSFRLGGHCYDLARLILRTAVQNEAGGIILEQGWTGQSPWEFSALMLAAALREGWRGPLFLRCGLPPLASDPLPDGLDSELLGQRLDTALRAQLRNVGLRASLAGVERARCMGELVELLLAAREHEASPCLNLRLSPHGRRLSPDHARAVYREIHRRLPADVPPPELLTLGMSDGLEAAEAWEGEVEGPWLALSGESPAEAHARPAAALPDRIVERRIETDWAGTMVMHPEFPVDRRRALLDWLRAGRRGDDPVEDLTLLRTHEYRALGHFEFELWDLEKMPGFRAEFQERLSVLLASAGLAGRAGGEIFC
jgi:hypothetical protein